MELMISSRSLIRSALTAAKQQPVPAESNSCLRRSSSFGLPDVFPSGGVLFCESKTLHSAAVESSSPSDIVNNCSRPRLRHLLLQRYTRLATCVRYACSFFQKLPACKLRS